LEHPASEQAPNLPFVAAELAESKKIICEKAEHANVHIPVPSFEPRPTKTKQLKGKTQDRLDDQEEWDREVTQLFEWAGLAALGSARYQLHHHASKKYSDNLT
jgi:ribonucleases P/MRP protein subunit RPP40